MERYKRKIIRSGVYLAFNILCIILARTWNLEKETAFCIWYLGTVWFGMMFAIRKIDRLGKRRKKEGRKRE